MHIVCHEFVKRLITADFLPFFEECGHFLHGVVQFVAFDLYLVEHLAVREQLLAHFESEQCHALAGFEEKSLRKLSAIVLNERVSKAQRLSNWEAGTLTEQQQEYAATDAWICLKIFDRLLREAPEGYKPTIISAQPTEQSAEHGAHRKHHLKKNKSKNSEQ